MRDLGLPNTGPATGADLLFVCGAAGTATDCGPSPPAKILTRDAVFVVYSLGKNAGTTGGAGVASTTGGAGPVTGRIPYPAEPEARLL